MALFSQQFMPPTSPRRFLPQYFLLLCAAMVVASCTSAPPAANESATVTLPTADIQDFSGNWEKNYQLSDDFNARFSLYVADIRRGFPTTQGRNDSAVGVNLGGGVDVDAINGLARFTEEITRTPTIEIVQEDGTINIDREDDFTLYCDYQDGQYNTSTNVFGSDTCGWNQERLIFQMALAGGLNITHQFSLSPDSKLLNVTTRVSSDFVSAPIVISSFYERFEPAAEDYNCVLTLTRSTVCSQRGTAQ
jgi:hypothetical protein